MRRVFFICLIVLTTALQAKPLKVKVSAKAAILINAETGAVLYEKNADDPFYPASITKIATLLYVLEKIQEMPDTIVSCPHHCLKKMNKSVKEAHHYKDPGYILEPDGTHFWIRRGEELPFIDLLYGMMLVSGNDASNYIAHHVGGSIPRFMKGLNGYLQKLGCEKTVFKNPHGLHHPHHRTTARDMALITREAFKNATFREIISTKEYERTATNLQSSRTFQNTAGLLQPGKFFYPRIVGMKNGYHSNAGHTFAGAARDGDRTVIAILMKCDNINDRYRDAIRLFETAFSEIKEDRLLFRKEENTFTRSIKSAKTPLYAILHDDINISYYESEEPNIKIRLNWEQLDLPIEKGSWVGEIQILDEKERVLETAPLFASKPVEKTLLASVISVATGEAEHPLPFRIFLTILLALGVGGLLLWVFKFSRELQK